MKNIYEKPIVLANEELSEGVYAASGAVEEPAGVSVGGVELVEEGNQWNKVNKYAVNVVNTGSEEAKDWSVSIYVKSGTATNATIYNGWLASASLSGNTITITPGGGGAVPANGSIGVELVVAYSSASVTVGK